MYKIPSLLIILSALVLWSSCRSEFERVRTSGNVTLIYEKANAYYDEGDYDRAIMLYELIIPAYRGRREAEDIYYKFANAHFLDRRYILSAHYFETFANTYTASDKREDAMFYAALSYYRLSPRYELDQSDSIQAINAFQLYVNSFPNSERVDECNALMDELREKLEKKAFEAANLYYNMNNYSSAVVAYENMLKEYPGTDRQEIVRFRMVKASFQLAENSIITKQQERYNESIEKADIFLRKFPASERSEEIKQIKERSQEALQIFQ